MNRLWNPLLKSVLLFAYCVLISAKIPMNVPNSCDNRLLTSIFLFIFSLTYFHPSFFIPSNHTLFFRVFILLSSSSSLKICYYEQSCEPWLVETRISSRSLKTWHLIWSYSWTSFKVLTLFFRFIEWVINGTQFSYKLFHWILSYFTYLSLFRGTCYKLFVEGHARVDVVHISW